MGESAIAELLAAKSGIRLDIGCGKGKQKDFVGMDVRAVEGVDIVHNLEESPWPIPDDSCLVVLASHILEHIKPWKFMDPAGGKCVMGEIWRVLKADGQLLVSCPYGVGPGFVQDPTHCNPINEATLQYFDPRFSLYQVYETPFMFTLEHVAYGSDQFLNAILVKRTTPSGEQTGDGESPELKMVKP